MKFVHMGLSFFFAFGMMIKPEMREFAATCMFGNLILYYVMDVRDIILSK